MRYGFPYAQLSFYTHYKTIMPRKNCFHEEVAVHLKMEYRNPSQKLE